MTDKKTETETRRLSTYRKRKTHVEDHPGVKEWISQFAVSTAEKHGFEPTLDQCIAAFANTALHAIQRLEELDG